MGVAGCPNHPGVEVTKRCTMCQESYCSACVEPTDDGPCCVACRRAPPSRGDAPAQKKSSAGVIIAVVVVVVLGVFGSIAVVAAIAIPNLLHARKSANEAAAIGALKTITTSQMVFREGDKERDGNLDYGMLSELSNTTLVDSVLGRGTKQGYFFEAAYSTTTSEFLWWAVARPAVAGSSGDRTFYVNSSGVIVYLNASSEPPPMPDPKTCELPKGAVRVGR